MHRADDAVGRDLQADLVRDLVDLVGRCAPRSVMVGSESLAGDDQHEVVRIDRLEPGRRRQRLAAVHRRPLHVGQGDRFAPVEGVRQPAIDEHPADQPPVLGHALERDARLGIDRRRPAPRPRPARRRRPPSSVAGSRTARYSSAAPLFSRIVSTTAGIGQGGGVAQDPALGDVAQQPSHDLARARLGQVRHEHQELGPRDRPDDVGDVLAELDGQRVGRLLVRLEDDEREDRLAADRRPSCRRRRPRPPSDGRPGPIRPRSSRSDGRPRSSRRRPGRAARGSRPRRAWRRRPRSTSPGIASSRSPCSAPGRRRSRAAWPARAASGRGSRHRQAARNCRRRRPRRRRSPGTGRSPSPAWWWSPRAAA